MGRPAIGITQCLDERGRWRPGRSYLYGDRAYARAVDGAGGSPLILPPQADPAEAVERIDALLLPGGDDFPPPRRYPGDIAFDLAPSEQVAFDRGVLTAALERKLPVLGICYGMQLIALHAGGALHYHLPLDLPDAIEHRLGEGADRHAVHIASGSRLAGVLRCERAMVNSQHHQAVADPGQGWRACAHGPDGVIEAIESDADVLGIGVQWHPEQLESPHARALFAALVRAASADGA